MKEISNARRFKDSLKLFGWQGGTIYQVKEEYARVLSKLNSLPQRLKKPDIYNITDGDFYLIQDLYARNIDNWREKKSNPVTKSGSIYNNLDSDDIKIIKKYKIDTSEIITNIAEIPFDAQRKTAIWLELNEDDDIYRILVDDSDGQMTFSKYFDTYDEAYECYESLLQIKSLIDLGVFLSNNDFGV